MPFKDLFRMCPIQLKQDILYIMLKHYSMQEIWLKDSVIHKQQI